MGLSRTVSEINGYFSRKSHFSHPVYFAPPLKGLIPLELGNGALGQKTRMMGLLDRQGSLTISSAVWIQYTNVTDGQTDRQTDTGRQQRLRLRIASRRGNKTITDSASVHDANCHIYSLFALTISKQTDMHLTPRLMQFSS